MAFVRPMLDDLELQQVQSIEVDGDQVWAQHAIPALEGDFFQGLGRRASRVTLLGVLTGAEVDEGLENLRHKFRAAAPVSFVADIATATRIDQMLIEEMGVRELAGKPSRFEYAFTLREYSPATPTEIEIPPPPPPPPPPPVETSVLEVQVRVVGQPDFDHSQTRVRVKGQDDDGNSIDQELSEREDDLWTADPFPSGNYTAQATTASPVMTGSSNPVRLRLGERQRAIIDLRPGQTIARAFIIHYWFDKAFVEPCMRHVLRQVAAYAQSHPDEKLVIIGHTDESGSDQYNQSLSERRARAAYAYLTFGRSPTFADAAVAEWDELRKARTVGVTRTINDTWGVRQYQSMLQDLGFYNGPIGDTHTPATDQAVRDFQAANGLGADGIMGNQSWPILIRAYMAQDNLAVPEAQFMPNASAANGCDHGVVQWLGCGEKMPVDSTPRGGCGDPAWRPNRRTDLLFVNDNAFPCDDIPEPVTINIRTSEQNPTGWCLGTNQGQAPQAPCCFLTFEASEQDKWLVQPAEPGTFVVSGRIQFEDGAPLADTPYVLIAPDGEFMDGEVVCSGQAGRKGTPILGQTDGNGRFTYPAKPKGPGVYTLEIQADVMARVEGEPGSVAKGPVVCKRLDGSSPFNVVLCQSATTFNLEVTDATQIGGAGSSTFLATRSTADVVTITAVSPPGTCLKVGSLIWSGGQPVPANPFQRHVTRAAMGQTTVTATMVATAATRAVDIFVVRVTLDVDADRDGVVEEDATDKTTWEFGAGKKGSVISCNNDDDNSDTLQDHLNDRVDGADDVNDLTPLIIRQSGPLPAGVTLELSVTDQSKLHVFNQRTPTGTAVIGPTPLPATFNISNSDTADVELGMEATSYPNSGFDGLIRLALSLKEGGAELAKDEIVVRVAPWIMPSHLQVTEEIYVVEIPGFNTAPASPFMDGIQAAATAAGITLRRANGSVYGEQWIQDSMEVGYSQTPTHAYSVVMNAINHRPLDPFAPDELLGKDYGLEQPPFNPPASPNTFDSTGNLEVSPPMIVAGKNFKLGRIFFGRGRPATPFNSNVKAFLTAQLIQKPFELDTDWLGVGHVDEIISFVPSAVGRPFRMILPSTLEAIRILTDLQNAGHGASTLFTGKAHPEFGERSIDSILGDSTLMAGNTFCQSRLDGVEASLKTELGLNDNDIIKFPGLFIEEASFPGVFAAHIPGMVNMLVITRPVFSDTQLVIPKPFGPVLSGIDQLEKDVLDKLTPLGYAVSQIRFVDDFEPYHVLLGEVHCGTNSKRNPHAVPWWEQEDF
jgi:outer membrane protein OmpA-like peptidoglycan-associated protein